jgi:hypothetical protein
LKTGIGSPYKKGIVIIAHTFSSAYRRFFASGPVGGVPWPERLEEDMSDAAEKSEEGLL